ncbi:MAG: pyridoxamine 5'-phosphate oxidase family protein [Rhodobacteraceae bacterium]|nr:pyridoxamine 5'-phosphate oxidase family protein [Paracoccaceae bacterium]
MGIQTTKLNGSFRAFIERQFLFFVATAGPTGRVNLSPKALDSLRILSDTEILWLSLSGSGNETASHVLQDPRMTLMFSAFDGDPLTLRVYGDAQVFHRHDPEWADLVAQFPGYAGARNIFRLSIDLVTTSCGTSIPEMQVVRNRAETELEPWYAEMTPEQLTKFWRKKNALSLDGHPTGLFKDT